MSPIMTIWGPVEPGFGPFDPEYEYCRSPEAQAYLNQLRNRIKETERGRRRETQEKPQGR